MRQEGKGRSLERGERRKREERNREGEKVRGEKERRRERREEGEMYLATSHKREEQPTKDR